MRVLMLHNDYREAGGERISVALEADALRQSGHEVYLLQVSNSDEQGALAVGRRMLDPRISRALVGQQIERFRPDLVHAQNLFPLLGAGAINAIRDNGLPWVRTLRNYRLGCLSANYRRNGSDCHRCTSAATAAPGVLHGCYRESMPLSAGAMAYAQLEGAAVRSHRPQIFILLSQHMSKVMTPLIEPSRSEISGNAVPAWPEAKADRRALPVDVLFVGRPTEDKGWPLFCEIAAQRPDLRFSAITSVTPPTCPMEVTVELDLSNQQVRQRMSQAAVVIVPSQWDEPFGRVAIEALAGGTPCVVSDNGGLPEIVASVDPSLVVTSAAVSDWLTALDRVIGLSLPDYSQLSARCRERWKYEYSPEAVADRLERIYLRAAGRFESYRGVVIESRP